MAIYKLPRPDGTRYARAESQQQARRIFSRSLSAFVFLTDVVKFGADRDIVKLPSPNYRFNPWGENVIPSRCIDADQGLAIRDYYANVSARELRAAQKGGTDHNRNLYDPRTAREVSRERHVFVNAESVSFE